VLNTVLQREQELRALLSSCGMALPKSDAAAGRLREVLAEGCLDTARNTTFEQLVEGQKAFVLQASLLLHKLDSPQSGAAAAAELTDLVRGFLGRLMTLSVVQPLMIWRLASINMETLEQGAMPHDMYRYVLAHMKVDWEDVQQMAAAYAAQVEVLQRLEAEEATLSGLLTAASAAGDSAAEAQLLTALERNMHQFTIAQGIVANHLCSLSRYERTARLIVYSYPYAPIAIGLGKAALEVVEEIKMGRGACGGQPGEAESTWQSVCCPPALRAKVEGSPSSSRSCSGHPGGQTSSRPSEVCTPGFPPSAETPGFPLTVGTRGAVQADSCEGRPPSTVMFSSGRSHMSVVLASRRAGGSSRDQRCQDGEFNTGQGRAPLRQELKSVARN